ncbi:MAG: DUF4433 domain-containing protein [Gracilibacteraceae bacterium]|jgi:hypothetical protein|nr:DUF4433 domain-containing protein [Gracilibacteraceae bacterium]
MPKVVKLYHIIHISKLSAILAENHLISDAEVQRRVPVGETIGMKEIKRRRLEELTLSSHPGLHVGECVPFYFCPRSVMLYMFHMRNHPDIEYKGGQEPILHLMADFNRTVEWANQHGLRWAFTNSNAGSRYFDDFTDVNDLNKLDWDAILSTRWSGHQDKKQAEFLIENRFPWELVEGIGVCSFEWRDKVNQMLAGSSYKPPVKPKPEWYY